ncbi:MAG: AMP-dependent synthetase, partial [Ruminococcaceae bacterium]|nr:AMP-dependent synthetase [Oscillospiraceae bacterium]
MQKNILEYLENTAVRVPDKLAFSTGKEDMTFGEVYSESRAIGSKLAALGLYGESVVILMDKHPRTVTAFWGVIYAGCFYACLDEKMPRARIDSIIENLSPRA